LLNITNNATNVPQILYIIYINYIVKECMLSRIYALVYIRVI
jgi:hypothetical protein